MCAFPPIGSSYSDSAPVKSPASIVASLRYIRQCGRLDAVPNHFYATVDVSVPASIVFVWKAGDGVSVVFLRYNMDPPKIHCTLIILRASRGDICQSLPCRLAGLQPCQAAEATVSVSAGR